MLPNQPFLSAPTPPNANFSQIVTTPVGSRVFLLGIGCLFEFVYEAKTDGSRGWLGMVVGYGGGVKEPIFKNWTTSLEGWSNFVPLMASKRETLVQLAIDPERDVIYGLTSDNKLQRWAIIRKTASTGGNALEPKSEGFISPVELARRQTEGSKFFDQGTKIVRIDVVTKMESDACLVLTTSSSESRIQVSGDRSTLIQWTVSRCSDLHEGWCAIARSRLQLCCQWLPRRAHPSSYRERACCARIWPARHHFPTIGN